MEYFKAFVSHLWRALVDVSLVSAISLMPLWLARLGDKSDQPGIGYWDFLWSGQLAFYALGSIATILIIIFRRGLPVGLSVLFGSLSLLSFAFLSWLIGKDPLLHSAPHTFIGSATFWIYLTIQICLVIVEANRLIGSSDALSAGDRKSRQVATGLGKRMGVKVDE